MDLEARVIEKEEHIFSTEWVWPVLVSLGLIVILTSFELLSIAIADLADRRKTPQLSAESVRRGRAA